MNFVSSRIYRKATQLALSEGLADNSSVHAVAQNAVNGTPYLPIKLLWEVYELADRNLEPGFAVRFGTRLIPEDYGTLGLSWKTCWTAREILERTERYMILVTNIGSIRVSEKEEVITLHLFREPLSRGTAMSNEVSFTMLVNVLEVVTHKPIKPIDVAFQHPSSGNKKPFLDFFQCSVNFNQEGNLIRFRSADLDIPTLKADKSIHQFLVERMEEEAKGIQVNANKLVNDVQSLIKEALPSGIPSVIQIGKHLGMSSRTLKRRLTEKGFTFRDLVKNTQEDISLELLKNSSHSIGEIAFQTGYSEQSAFNRAFKRWTGQSPVEYRNSALF